MKGRRKAQLRSAIQGKERTGHIWMLHHHELGGQTCRSQSALLSGPMHTQGAPAPAPVPASMSVRHGRRDVIACRRAKRKQKRRGLGVGLLTSWSYLRFLPELKARLPQQHYQACFPRGLFSTQLIFVIHNTLWVLLLPPPLEDTG